MGIQKWASDRGLKLAFSLVLGLFILSFCEHIGGILNSRNCIVSLTSRTLVGNISPLKGKVPNEFLWDYILKAASIWIPRTALEKANWTDTVRN
jgi:hypothetical protein